MSSTTEQATPEVKLAQAMHADLKRFENAGFVNGLRIAANEVAGHWNDAFSMTNQKDQAERSARALRKLADMMEKKLTAESATEGSPT